MTTARLVSVDANVVWKVTETSNPHRFIAVCDELDIAVEGTSLEELQSLIPEAIGTLMLDLYLDDEFDGFLRARGWNVNGEMPSRADVTDDDVDDIRFDVPFELIAAGSGGSKQRSLQ